MLKRKLIGGVAFAAALGVGHTAAFADTDRDAFLSQIGQLSPSSEKALKAVGEDYKNKCGTEPTVAQYRTIATDSPAYAYQLAKIVMADGKPPVFTPDERARYQELLNQVDCAKI